MTLITKVEEGGLVFFFVTNLNASSTKRLELLEIDHLITTDIFPMNIIYEQPHNPFLRW